MSVVISDFPNFSSQGYQVSHELGRNNTGGRVVYLAHTIEKPIQPVVIKQFQFARGAGWSEFKEIDREMQVLKDLKYPGIPYYLYSFPTNDGYCIVQEYKKAEPLSTPRSFDPDEIKQIAIALLNTLVYLQNRIPLLIHRDIKPENVLVDEQLNVYLIDFGFARIGGGEVAMSSVAVGTFGFMAPEQMYNKGLTAATDLYSLGAMLIALLTNTKSTKMDELIDENGKIEFRKLTPNLSIHFIEWLDKMIAPKTKDRYPNAKVALEALKPIYVVRFPILELNLPSLEFKATQLGEIITKNIEISNITPETTFNGCWSIESHHNDTPNLTRKHKWISFSELEIEGVDRVVCNITVDTSKLTAQSTGTRKVIFHSNAIPETNSLLLQISTAPLPIQVKKLPATSMIGLLVFSIGCGLSLKVDGVWEKAGNGLLGGFFALGIFLIVKVFSRFHTAGMNDIIMGAMLGCFGGYLAGGNLVSAITGGTLGSWVGLMTGGIVLGNQAFLGSIIGAIISVVIAVITRKSDVLIMGSIIGAQAGILGAIADVNYISLPESRRHQHGLIFLLLAAIGIFGINLGAMIAHPNIYLLFTSFCVAIIILFLVLNPQQKAAQSIRSYRQKERFLNKL